MQLDYKIIIFLIFGIAPSLVWLSYYLRKDIHPEPKKMVLKIFLWGVLITLPVYFVQIGLEKLCNDSLVAGFISKDLYWLIYWFLIISLSEEFFKFLVIKFKVLGSPDLDEPLDIMLYMVITALGFAALENILYLSSIDTPIFNEVMYLTVIITLIRFIGATFLHTLCSAVIGYGLAISFCEIKHKFIYFFGGFVVAVLLHGLYDFSIMQLRGYARVAIPVIVIVVLAFIVFSAFEKLKQVKSICKIK